MNDPGPSGDPIVVVLASIGLGAAAGGAVLTFSTVIVRTLQAGQPAETDVAAAAVLTAGVLAGLVTAVVAAVRASRSIADAWRRSVAGAIAMFGAAVISLVAMPLEMIGGRLALLGLVAALAAAAALAHRIVRRAAASP